MPILSPQASSHEMLNYWNQVYAQMNSFGQAQSTKLRLEGEKRLVKKHLPRLAGKKILKLDLWDEVRNSGFLLWAGKEGAEVFGIDISSSLTQEAEKLFRKERVRAMLSTADMRYLPFPDNTFDLLWSIGTIEHVNDPSLVFLEAYRVLKRGGIAIIGCPNRHDPYLSGLVIYLGNKLGFLPYGDEISYTYGQLESLMKGPGFAILERTSPYLLPWFIRYPDIYLHLKLRPLDLLLRPFIFPFFYLNKVDLLLRHCNHIVCVGRKK
jgi:SAM-dependent methyltransferase